MADKHGPFGHRLKRRWGWLPFRRDVRYMPSVPKVMVEFVICLAVAIGSLLLVIEAIYLMVRAAATG